MKLLQIRKAEPQVPLDLESGRAFLRLHSVGGTFPVSDQTISGPSLFSESLVITLAIVCTAARHLTVPAINHLVYA